MAFKKTKSLVLFTRHEQVLATRFYGVDYVIVPLLESLPKVFYYKPTTGHPQKCKQREFWRR